MATREQNAHRESMALGSDTKPPVLYRGEYPQWKTRFEMWIENHQNGEEMMRSLTQGDYEAWDDIPGAPDADPPVPPTRVRRTVLTDVDRQNIRADKMARTYLLQALPNDLFMAVDSHKTAHSIYMEIARQMKGTAKGRDLQYGTVIHNYENFRAKETETLEDVYARLCAALNDLRKHKIEKSQYEIVIKFLGCLQPEWKRYTVGYKLNDLQDTDFHTLFENLLQHQDEVQAKITRRLRKTGQSSSDKLALISDKKSLAARRVSTPSPVSTPTPSDSDSDDDLRLAHKMETQLILLTKDFEKRYGRKVGSSNHLRYSAGKQRKDKSAYGGKGKEKLVDDHRRRDKDDYRRREDEYRRRDDDDYRRRNDDYRRQSDDDHYRRRDDNYRRRDHEDKRKGEDDYRRPRDEDRRRIGDEEKKVKFDDGNRTKKDDKGETQITCYNCGKTGHYARECRLPKQRSAEYWRRKANAATERMKLAKDRDRGKALMIEEDHWLDATSSSDTEDENLAFMAKTDDEEPSTSGSDSDPPENDDTDNESEVHQNPVLLKFHNQLSFLSKRLSETKVKLRAERLKNKELETRHVKNHKVLSEKLKENAGLVSKLEFTKKELDNLMSKNEQLNLEISEITCKLNELNVENSSSLNKYNAIFEERIELYKKIKSLEDEFSKRGQTDQTIYLNQPKDTAFYNLKEGLGFENLGLLQRAVNHVPNIYDVRYMGLGYQSNFLRSTADCLDEENIKRNVGNVIEINLDYDKFKVNSDSRTEPIEIIETFSPQESLPVQSCSRVYVPTKVLENQVAELQTELTTLQKTHESTCFSLKNKIQCLEKENTRLSSQNPKQMDKGKSPMVVPVVVRTGNPSKSVPCPSKADTTERVTNSMSRVISDKHVKEKQTQVIKNFNRSSSHSGRLGVKEKSVSLNQVVSCTTKFVSKKFVPQKFVMKNDVVSSDSKLKKKYVIPVSNVNVHDKFVPRRKHHRKHKTNKLSSPPKQVWIVKTDATKTTVLKEKNKQGVKGSKSHAPKMSNSIGPKMIWVPKSDSNGPKMIWVPKNVSPVLQVEKTECLDTSGCEECEPVKDKIDLPSPSELLQSV